MPKPKKKYMPLKQGERSQAELERLAAVSELSPAEAEEALDKVVRILVTEKKA